MTLSAESLVLPDNAPSWVREAYRLILEGGLSLRAAAIAQDRSSKALRVWLVPGAREKQYEKTRESYLRHRERRIRENVEGARRRRAKDPARFRAQAKSYRERAPRYTCPHCGYVYGQESAARGKIKATRCPGCIERRRVDIVRWWADGESLRLIANRLGWTVNHLGVEFARMRKMGYNLPHRYPTDGKGRRTTR